MVNPDADGYSKTLIHREILQKTQDNNLLKIKSILHLTCQGPILTSAPSSVTSLAMQYT